MPGKCLLFFKRSCPNYFDDIQLYHASDISFEYVKPGIGFDADVDLDEMSVDEYTDALKFENSFKIAVYDPAPGSFGGYLGFQKK